MTDTDRTYAIQTPAVCLPPGKQCPLTLRYVKLKAQRVTAPSPATLRREEILMLW